MSPMHDAIHSARKAFLGDPAQILATTHQALRNANGNQSHNTYLWRDEAWTLREAERAIERLTRQREGASPLCGLPISVKDCFDLEGSPTSCGTKFYRDLNGIARQDSWLVAELRKAGAVITGKTHLHPLAYGITGENPDFGDCLQPGNPTALTGGSSSGAAASILEGSAIAAIGTDTGGSIRVPAALCGLAGYRASIGIGNWQGGAHLAQSFDTMGWLCRNVSDLSYLASLFGAAPQIQNFYEFKFCVPSETFFHDCEPDVLLSFGEFVHFFDPGVIPFTTVDLDWWHDSREIFAAIQASEAAQLHAGHFDHFEPSIRERLEWGASLSSTEIAALRLRHAEFRERMDHLLAEHRFLMLPCAPVARLTAGADHSQTRARLLRYTTPASLAGMPAITIPLVDAGKPSGGVQIVAARGHDAQLLNFVSTIQDLRSAARTVLQHRQERENSPW
jgi:aspartyl-tRNA(Asn)/glutamyl-tRNA(Gln) amidotransferase subunit A